MALLTSVAGRSQAGDETPSDQLRSKLGLKQAGTFLILEAESEVHSKITDARRLSRELSNAIMRQQSTVSEKDYQATIKQLNEETNALRAQLNSTNQMINQLPKFRGRLASSMAMEQNYELNQYKSQLNWEINQRTAFLAQLRSNPFDPKAKLRLDSEVRDKR